MLSSLAFTDGSARKPERPSSMFRTAVVATAAAGALFGAVASTLRKRRS